MTIDAIVSEIRKKIYRPIYVLQGEESYYIDNLCKFIEANVLTEAEKAFNFTVFYGKDADPKSVMDTAIRVPMASNYQLVVIREAQSMRSFGSLEPYFNNPSKSTVLVICYKNKKLDKRKTVTKVLEKNALFYTSDKLKENQIAPWIITYVKKKKLEISSKAVNLLAEHLGTDVSKISNELDKLSINLADGSMIDVDLIEKNVGINKDYNVFEFQKALGSRNTVKAHKILNYFVKNINTNPLPYVIGTLASFFSRLYLYHGNKHLGDAGLKKVLGYFIEDFKIAGAKFDKVKTEQSIELLHLYDLKSKGLHSANTPPGELLKELTIKILNL